LYGAEGSDAPCTQFYQTHSLKDIKTHLGDGSDTELGYDWQKNGINEVEIALKAKPYLAGKYLVSVVSLINNNKRDDDFLLMPVAHKAIAEGVGLRLTCESGIGYFHSFAPYRAFESEFIKNYTYGAENGRHVLRPLNTDVVIPNYFDDNDFEFLEEKQGFMLFIGRIVYAKGITTAVKVAESLKKKLIIAGQGAYSWNPETGRLTGKEFDVTSKYIEYIGLADKETRKTLMSNASCVFVPSLYVEPFGGVNVEAQLSGTPVLTTPFGAFPETVRHGETGFICNTNEEFIQNAQKVHELDPKKIRKHAERYLMDNVKYEYQKWFDLLYTVNFSNLNK